MASSLASDLWQMKEEDRLRFYALSSSLGDVREYLDRNGDGTYSPRQTRKELQNGHPGTAPGYVKDVFVALDELGLVEETASTSPDKEYQTYQLTPDYERQIDEVEATIQMIWDQ